MGCNNGRTVQIKSKELEKITADHVPHSPKVGVSKSDIDHDTCKDNVSLDLNENDFVKVFRTQEQQNLSKIDYD